MPRYNAPFEIHVHGQVPLRSEVRFEELQEALKPLWKYAGSKSLSEGSASSYTDEPGINFDPHGHLVQICWTVSGDHDFRQTLDEVCMNLNDIAESGAAIEVKTVSNKDAQTSGYVAMFKLRKDDDTHARLF